MVAQILLGAVAITGALFFTVDLSNKSGIQEIEYTQLKVFEPDKLNQMVDSQMDVISDYKDQVDDYVDVGIDPIAR